MTWGSRERLPEFIAALPGGAHVMVLAGQLDPAALMAACAAAADRGGLKLLVAGLPKEALPHGAREMPVPAEAPSPRALDQAAAEARRMARNVLAVHHVEGFLGRMAPDALARAERDLGPELPPEVRLLCVYTRDADCRLPDEVFLDIAWSHGQMLLAQDAAGAAHVMFLPATQGLAGEERNRTGPRP